jgi:rubredoxin
MACGSCGKPALWVFQGAVGAFLASTAPGVPSMFDSLGVKVLCPGLVG